jgi:histidinol-phosphate aminotransferase
MDFIIECLAIGNLQDAEAHPPVEAILNVSEFEYATDAIYKHLYFPDFEYLQDLPLIEQGTAFIRQQIQHRNRVLVHCFAGISRSTIICMAYLYECGMSLDEALTLVQARHPEAWPHEALLRSLRDWCRLP